MPNKKYYTSDKHSDYGRSWNMSDDEIESPSYLTTIEFKTYAARIGKIIAASRKPIGVADIHRKLGDAVKRNWTFDALDFLSDAVEPVNEIVPVKYRIKSATIWQAFTRSETNAHLFSRSRKHDKTYAFALV